MVTVWPPEVVSVKPEEDALATVPTAPPAAGPDRALDPWPLDPESPAEGWPLLLVLLLAVLAALLEVAAAIQ
jgi:hypothetical protein